MKTVTLSKTEYTRLKAKAEIADDVLLQLDQSLKDAQTGKIRKSG